MSAPQVCKIFEHALVQVMRCFQPEAVKPIADAAWAPFLSLPDFAYHIQFRSPCPILLTPSSLANACQIY